MILLASRSPRRRELLALGGWHFQLAPAEVDERVYPGEDPQAYVLRLAELKARRVADQAPSGWLIVGADTAVVDQHGILGKPLDSRDAVDILRRLRGRVHCVYTALAVLHAGDQKLLTDVCRTNVPMRSYTDAQIMAYVATGDPMDKAGAYAIQHAGFRPVAQLTGCYANVVGLPLCHLVRTLSEMGVAPEQDVSIACQQALNYDCSIYQEVLQGEW